MTSAKHKTGKDKLASKECRTAGAIPTQERSGRIGRTGSTHPVSGCYWKLSHALIMTNNHCARLLVIYMIHCVYINPSSYLLYTFDNQRNAMVYNDAKRS